MALNVNRALNEAHLSESTTSIASSPVVACAVATNSGYVQRCIASAGGTTTGTINVTVIINNGSDITNGNLNIAAGSNARNGSVYELPLIGAGSTSGVWVNEGDIITFTPSGGTGSSIPGAFGLVIRTLV
jgi:hypothetical protein